MVPDDRPDPADSADSAGHGLRAADSAVLLRPDVVAAYAGNPRNELVAVSTSPENWRARWLPTVLAAVLTGVLVAAGGAIRVPVEAPAVVTAVAPGRLSVLMQGDPPSEGSPVTVSVTTAAVVQRYTATVDEVTDSAVELRTGDAAGIGVGTRLTLELGEESLLAALATA